MRTQLNAVDGFVRIDVINGPHFQGGFDDWLCFYIQREEFSAGGKKPGHVHLIDHVGNLVSGACRVTWRHKDNEADRGVYEILVPAKIMVRADYLHEIEFLAPSVWECWFAKAEADRVYGEGQALAWHKPVKV